MDRSYARGASVVQVTTDKRGIVIKNKAILVAQGYTHEEGIDYDEVFAPVARIKSIRLFLAYASFKDFLMYQMDVKNAFLYGKIEEEVYVCQPPGFEDPDFPDRVYKVEKALYGLHQALRAWYETLSTYLLENRFQRGQIDKTLFIKRDQGDILIVQVYVDDIIFGSTKKKLCTEFEKMMHKKFQMSSMGELTFFLGLQVKQKEDGIFISQDKYVTKILKKFGFSDVKIANTPMETHKPLLKDADGEDVDEHMYRSMIGSLMYLTSSRPDIMFAVCVCARFQVNPKVSHLHAVKRIFRYLKGCRLISWQCKKQTMVAKSTTEAEYAAASCYVQVLWIQNQLLDYGDSNEKKLIQMIKIHTDKNVADLLMKAFDKGIRVNAGDSKLMLLGINLLLLEKVNAARHNLLLLVKVFGNMKRFGKGLSGAVTPLFPTMMVQALEEISEEPVADEAVHEERGDSVERATTTASSLKVEQDSGNIIRTQSTAIPNVPLPQGIGSGGRPRRQETMGDKPAQNREDRLKLKELMDLCTKLSDRVLDLETTKTTQAKEIASLKKRVKKLERKRKLKTPGMKRLFKIGRSARVISSDEDSLGDQEDASKQGRKITDIDQDAEVTLVDETQGRYDDAQMFDTYVFNGEEVFVAEQSEKVVEEVVTAANVEVSTASPTAAIITTVELTLAQTLAELKSARPKTKGVVMQEPSETTTTTTISSKDKGKGIMVEEPLKMKKKDQVLFDEQEAIRLQAQFDEEERIAREKEEVNAALIAQWNDIQDKVETDYELAQRLQAEEQEELIIKEKSKLFQQLLEKRMNHFKAKRV
ncbi:putative ribonuclease H-like domain-containing protein [Tanacetum coccineum]